MRLFLFICISALLFSCEKNNSKDSTVVFGHAGTSFFEERAIHPPNTIESVIYALDVLDADGVEIDVQMTKDSVLVLFHDDFLDLKTNASGCVADKLSAEIKEVRLNNTKYRIAELKEIVRVCISRRKKLFIDMKNFNFCQNTSIDYSALNYGLNSALEGVENSDLARITFNSKGIEVLNSVQDSVVNKSFETPFLDLGIEYFSLYDIDILTFRLDQAKPVYLEEMRAKGIPFCIYGLKTQKEVKQAHSLFPDEVISDNIAYSKKISN